MLKKSILCLFITSLLFASTACDKGFQDKQGVVLSPQESGGQPIITIVMSSSTYLNFKAEKILTDYVEKFERDMGVEVKIDLIRDNHGKMIDQEEADTYIRELSPKLYAENGPELIFTEYFFFNQVIKQNVVVELSSKIHNISKIYKGLLNDETYYVPIGMRYYSKGVNKKILEEFNLPEPEFNWTQNDYFSLWDKWMTNSIINFNASEYYSIYSRYIESQLNINIIDKKVELSIPTVIEGMRQARQCIFNGKYKLNKNYTYKNYYNMLFEENSEEALASQEIYDKNRPFHISRSYLCNAFRAGEIEVISNRDSVIALPEFADKRPYINTMGFLINKNSRQLELAYEFINGLLSDEQQLALFNQGNYHYYPVNKDIEEEITKDEIQKVVDTKAIELKSYVLEQLKNGICDTDVDINSTQKNIKNMLSRDLSKYILADETYSEEELNLELSKLIDKYNIWLSE